MSHGHLIDGSTDADDGFSDWGVTVDEVDGCSDGPRLKQYSEGDQGDVGARGVPAGCLQVRAHYKEPLDVPAIARSAYVSPSTLHHDFKAVTSTSPMQYLKNIRLHEARLLMVRDDKTAAGAARKVGYQSPSQFSREYRRLFGAPPGQPVRPLQAESASQV